MVILTLLNYLLQTGRLHGCAKHEDGRQVSLASEDGIGRLVDSA